MLGNNPTQMDSYNKQTRQGQGISNNDCRNFNGELVLRKSSSRLKR